MPAPQRPKARVEKIEGYLEVGTSGDGDVVVNLDRERNGIGHLVFSPTQARTLARTLQKKAAQAEAEARS